MSHGGHVRVSVTHLVLQTPQPLVLLAAVLQASRLRRLEADAQINTRQFLHSRLSSPNPSATAAEEVPRASLTDTTLAARQCTATEITESLRTEPHTLN